MTEAHISDEHDAPHEGPIKTPKQLILAVFFAFAVPIIVITLLTQFVANERRPAAGSNAMQAAEVAERIQPVGQVEVNANAAEPTGTAAAPAAEAGASAAAAAVASAQAAMANVAAATAAAPAAKADAGAPPALYTQVCFACHGTGAAGAPKLGDKAAWAPRVKLGIDGLTAAAIKGIGAMPPRGGSTASDAEIKAVVAYMVHDVQ